jgi:hypothetical protein
MPTDSTPLYNPLLTCGNCGRHTSYHHIDGSGPGCADYVPIMYKWMWTLLFHSSAGSPAYLQWKDDKLALFAFGRLFDLEPADFEKPVFKLLEELAALVNSSPE